MWRKSMKILELIWEIYKVAMCAMFLVSMAKRSFFPPAAGELHDLAVGSWWVISSQITTQGWQLHYSWSGLAVLAALLTVPYGYKFIRYLRKRGWQDNKDVDYTTRATLVWEVTPEKRGSER